MAWEQFTGSLFDDSKKTVGLSLSLDRGAGFDRPSAMPGSATATARTQAGLVLWLEHAGCVLAGTLRHHPGTSAPHRPLWHRAFKSATRHGDLLPCTGHGLSRIAGQLLCGGQRNRPFHLSVAAERHSPRRRHVIQPDPERAQRTRRRELRCGRKQCSRVGDIRSSDSHRAAVRLADHQSLRPHLLGGLSAAGGGVCHAGAE
jgi:hypothetical protein